MKLDKNTMILYAVTDRSWLGENNLKIQVEQAIKSGATFIQLREKDLSFDEFVKVAFELKTVTDKYKIPYVINDNIEVAILVNADGVHVGQNDIEAQNVRAQIGHAKILGVSAQTVEQALKAQKNGADYIGVGAIFSTTTKDDADNVSLDTLKKICNAVSIPVVAIGGISKRNIIKLEGIGISGIAVISAIFGQKDIEDATRELLELSKNVVVS